MSNIDNRQEFVVFVEAKLSNPNGDADTGLPRVNPDNERGLMTDACLKRKIRNFVAAQYDGVPQMGIYYGMKTDLEQQRERVHKQHKGKLSVAEAKALMCKEFWDVRVHGAVMSMKKFDSGAVRGAVQIDIAESVDPVTIVDLPGTRTSVDGKDGKQQRDKNGEVTGTFCSKSVISYGLYKFVVRFNPHQAKQNGVTEQDMAILQEAIKHMFTFDAAATRSNMTVRKLFHIQHNTPLGDGNFVDQITAQTKVSNPQQFEDYTFSVPDSPCISEVL